MTWFNQHPRGGSSLVSVVTGATSFVGLELVRQLLAAGNTVFAVVRPGSPNNCLLPTGAGLHIVELSLGDLGHLLRHVPHAEAFYHLGWEGGGAKNRALEDVQFANVGYTAAAAHAAVALGCKSFLFTGSQAECGPQSVPLDENAALRPTTPYGRAKIAAAEQSVTICNEAGISFAHGRIFSAYGPGDHPWTLVSQCVQGFLSGQDVALSTCEQEWNYLYISDTASALRAIQGRDGVYHIAHPVTRPLREFVETIHRLCGGRGRPLYAAREPGVESPYGIAPAVSKLLSTGWHPLVDFEQGICRILEEQGSNGS